ncbi:MAG: SEL1-like repeat protein, partial [Treponema sp.]|nr:SEL1-like repeat protein [Treponema sp.]
MKKFLSLLFVTFVLLSYSFAKESFVSALTKAKIDLIDGLTPQTRLYVSKFNSSNEQVEKFIKNEILESLISSNKFTVVTRDNMELIDKELDYQYSGYVSDESALSLCERLGAQEIIFGEITEHGDRYTLNIKVLDVEKGSYSYYKKYDFYSDSFFREFGIKEKHENEFFQIALKAYDQEIYSVAYENFKKAESKGDKECLYYLGRLYQEGWGIEKNFKKALGYFNKSAKINDNRSLYFAGMMYLSGVMGKVEYDSAKICFEKAAFYGNVDALYELGNIFYRGLGVKKDIQKAKEWYEKAAARGNSDAQTLLGDIYYNGESVAKDYKKAFKWYEQAGLLGNKVAQYNLGNIYWYQNLRDNLDDLSEDECKKIEKEDDANAKFWYKKAAAQGYPDAFVGLSRLEEDNDKAISLCKNAVEIDNNCIAAYERLGYLYPKDSNESFKYYLHAAELNSSLAQYMVGYKYFYGRGITQDYKKALYWFGKASDQDDVDAQLYLGVMNDRGLGTSQNYEKARFWYEKAAEKGNKTALNNLGSFYYRGLGVSTDYTKARQYFEKAVQGDNPYLSSFNWLANIYYNGYDVDKDYKKALYYCEKAAERADNETANYAQKWAGFLYENGGYGLTQDYSKALE